MGVELEGAADEVDRLVEPLAPLGQHVAQVVERLGVVGVLLEHAPERALRLLEPPAALEDRAELEQDQGVVGKPFLGRPQDPHRLVDPVVLAVEPGQGHVRDGLVLVARTRPLEQRDRIVDRPARGQHPGVEPHQVEIVAPRAPDLGHQLARLVEAPRFEIHLNELRLQPQVGRHELEGTVQGLGGAIEVAAVLLGESQLLQESGHLAGIDAARPRPLHHRGQDLRHLAIAAHAAEGAGQQVGAPQLVRLELDHPPGRDLGGVEVAGLELDAGQPIPALGVVGPDPDELLEHLDGSVDTPRVGQRIGELAAVPGPAGAVQDGELIGGGGFVPLVEGLVRAGQQHLAIGEPRLEVEHVAQHLDRRFRLPGGEVEPPQGDGQHHVGPLWIARLGEVVDGQIHVGLRRPLPGLHPGRVDEAQRAVGLAVLGIPVQRLVPGLDRLVGPVAARVEAGQLGPDPRRRGIELDRPPIGVDGLLDPIVPLQGPALDEGMVRGGAIVRTRRLGRRRLGLGDGSRRQDAHDEQSADWKPHKGRIVPQRPDWEQPGPRRLAVLLVAPPTPASRAGPPHLRRPDPRGCRRPGAGGEGRRRPGARAPEAPESGRSGLV